MQIKSLFDPSKNIYRTIEKVISYNASQEARLKSEITEYIATESIEDQLEKLLSKMQLAMEVGGENEVGVWVSGFYGSGKSSFTKYLGLALDEHAQIDGTRFLKYLQDRLHKAQTSALLNTVANRFPAAVVMLDLASEMLAGATMEEVSTVLYYKVLQWAGYSQNLKVAAFERRLKKDGRYAEFTGLVTEQLGVEWPSVQNDPLVIDSLLPDIAHQMYPALFKTNTAFTTETSDFVRFETDRVKEMLEIVRETSGKQHILFVIDEVGQYVAAREHLILNLDGLAKNLKTIGGGKVWIIATAQQTLTEDDPRAALNSPLLFKLSARFPIQLDLEAKDIKEICYRRLLGKSPAGEQALAQRFEQYGPELRHNTKLQNAKYYNADFDKQVFTNLYPFLPAQFDILLQLLGALARWTGGIGLRSAIKVVQDILIEGVQGQPPVADQPVDWLVTTVTLYDALEKDIRRAAPSIHKAVEKIALRFHGSPLHQEVAKTVAVLQILDNIPVSLQNVAALSHPSLASASRLGEIEAAVREMIDDGQAPFSEKEGGLRLLSEKVSEIEQERAAIPVRAIESQRILNAALTNGLSPLPSTKLHSTLTVTSGLKMQVGGVLHALAGEKETVQTIVEWAAAEGYEAARTRLVEESRQRSAQYIVYWLGRQAEKAAEQAIEIYRSEEIARRHRNDPDQEVRDYCTGQAERAKKLADDLGRELLLHLRQGSLIFRGQMTAVESLDANPLEAAKKHLAGVAEQVFDRYTEAPVRADTSLVEKFLKLGSLKSATSETDPLNLVQINGGAARINAHHKALVSIHDYLNQGGAVDGKRLSEHFSDAPFGWSPDTLRYLVAALLVNGEIKLKISGREIKVTGQQAIEGLRNNNAFKSVGISLRDEQLSPEVLARAAGRLSELIGDSVDPLEQEISKAAALHFPGFQKNYSSLESRLSKLGLPGADDMHDLTNDLADILASDASDLPQRLGSPDSALYNNLKWAAAVSLALKNGLEVTIQGLREHWAEINALPEIGAPGKLKAAVEETLQPIAERLAQENFYQYSADLNTALTTIRNHVRDAALELIQEQAQALHAFRQSLAALPEWQEFTVAEQQQTLAEVDGWAIQPAHTLAGFKQLLNHEYTLQQRGQGQKARLAAEGRRRIEERVRDSKVFEKQIEVAATLSDKSRLAALVEALEQTQREALYYTHIQITIRLQPDPPQE